MSTRASRRLVGRGTVRETQPRWARGSLRRKAPAIARLEAACGARQPGLNDAENDGRRPARLEEACGARQRARMRGKGRAGDEKIVSVAHLRTPRRSAAHLRMPRGGLAMLIRLPKIPTLEEACGARTPAGGGQSESAAQSSRAASVRASLTPLGGAERLESIQIAPPPRRPPRRPEHQSRIFLPLSWASATGSRRRRRATVHPGRET